MKAKTPKSDPKTVPESDPKTVPESGRTGLPTLCHHAEPCFWQLFALSLGLSLLMTGLALLYQRQRDKKSSC